jgi:multidrug resistance protein, MATE family
MNAELRAPAEHATARLAEHDTLLHDLILHDSAGSAPSAVVVRADAPAEESDTLNRRVVGLAWPVVGEHLLETLLGVVDTLLVAGLGVAAIAGVGSSLQIMSFILAALAALSVGSSILVAQAIGAGDKARASALARQSLIWSVILSVPLALVGWTLALPIMGIFGMEPEVTRVGADYLQVTMGTVVVLVSLIIGGGVLRGAGDSRTPMVVTAFANVINAVLAYGLIYGMWGLPEMGVIGSAWATFVARGVALLVLLRVLWVGKNGITIRGAGGWRPRYGIARNVLGLGIPAAVEQILFSCSFLLLTIMVAHLGTATLAAQRIAMSAIGFAYLPAIGFGLAATALVGQSIGARRFAEAGQVARIATIWAVGLMCLNMVLLFAFATPLVRWFSPDPEVVRIGTGALYVIAIILPVDGLAIVLAGALRGTGDTRYPLIVGTATNWASLLLAWPAVRLLDGGLPMAWAPWIIVLPVCSWLILRHFRRRMRMLQSA